MPPKPPYICYCCGYETPRKADMRIHLYKKKPCPKILNNIELTDEIKEFILANRIYKPDDKSTIILLNKEIQKLKIENILLKDKKREDYYQIIVEEFLKGTHKRLNCGVTDVTTDIIHAEIKEWCSYKQCHGQLLSYNLEDPRPTLQVYLFGTYGKKAKEAAYQNLIQFNFEVYTFDHHDKSVDIIEYRTNEIKFTYQITITDE